MREVGAFPTVLGPDQPAKSRLGQLLDWVEAGEEFVRGSSCFALHMCDLRISPNTARLASSKRTPLDDLSSVRSI
jgi:hypothetical protein